MRLAVSLVILIPAFLSFTQVSIFSAIVIVLNAIALVLLLNKAEVWSDLVFFSVTLLGMVTFYFSLPTLAELSESSAVFEVAAEASQEPRRFGLSEEDRPDLEAALRVCITGPIKTASVAAQEAFLVFFDRYTGPFNWYFKNDMNSPLADCQMIANRLSAKSPDFKAMLEINRTDPPQLQSE